jgi:hypothetical protein
VSMIDHAAMAVAAKACGYAAIGDAIMAKSLGPEATVRLFRLCAARDRNRAAAIVLIAGVVARYSTNREAFDGGELERQLVATLIPRAQLAEVDRLAVQICRRHWREIASL